MRDWLRREVGGLFAARLVVVSLAQVGRLHGGLVDLCGSQLVGAQRDPILELEVVSRPCVLRGGQDGVAVLERDVILRGLGFSGKAIAAKGVIKTEPQLLATRHPTWEIAP